MIILFTDFGLTGPYLGQMQAVLHSLVPGVPVVNLFADAPVHNPRASAYLLAAYTRGFPTESVFVTVVDPGVGSWQHHPVVVKAGLYWFVGPDNGLFNVVSKSSRDPADWWRITWRPAGLSASFHGRDLYAPIAARVAQGSLSGCTPIQDKAISLWDKDLFEVIYIDSFGNAITGVRAKAVPKAKVVSIHNRSIARAETFSQVPLGKALWYENSNGLVEISVNQGRADTSIGLAIGDKLQIN